MHYNDQLHLLQEKIWKKRELTAKRTELRAQQEDLGNRIRELKKALSAEQADVDRLERTSLSSIFYTLIGKKEEMLDKERMEAYAAEVKYDSAVQQLDLIRNDLYRIDSRLYEIADCEEQYAALLQQKSAALKASASADAVRISQLESELAKQQQQKRELKEAISAGLRALAIADSILSSLDSAEGWGTWDLVGGGMLSDLAKHSHLDEAQAKVQQLQNELYNFKTELADVAVQADMQLNIDGFLRFADYFFDGLFADWAVLDKINQSQSNMQHTRNQIEDVLSKLRDMDTTTDRTITRLQAERDSVIASAEL